jgi:succinate dehydrogenase/fumarate reductase cytochrome b subunit
MIMSLRMAHRISGAVIGSFIALHFANHAALFVNVESHIRFMEAVRPIYRNIAAESLLLLALIFQIVSGLTMLWRRRKQISGIVGWLQSISAIYLLFFLIVHLAAVFQARISDGTDTNIYFAVAGYYAGLASFFVPYYFLAVTAFATHLGCGLFWILARNNKGNRKALVICIACGLSFATALTINLAGWIEPIKVPQHYLAKFVN